MTTDLGRLIEAVEAGDDAAFRRYNRAVFATPAQDMGLQLREDDSYRAYRDSLDAAVALHEVLLPGWWAEISIRGSVHHAEVEEAGGGATACANNMPDPARALLLATLRAYSSTREGK